MQQRPATQPELNDATLARLQVQDPVYRALLDHAYALMEERAQAALQPKLTENEREYLAGGANGLQTFISNVEATRERAREEMKKRQVKANPV